MAALQRQIKGQFAIVTLQGQVRAAVDQYSDCFQVPVLGGSVEGGVTALLADVWVGMVLEEQVDDLCMPGCRRRLERNSTQIVTRRRVDWRAGLDEIFCHIVVAKITRQAQRLESIRGEGVDQLRIAGQQPQYVVDLAGCSSFEDRQRHCFIGEERGELRLFMVRRDQNRAENRADLAGRVHRPAECAGPAYP